MASPPRAHADTEDQEPLPRLSLSRAAALPAVVGIVLSACSYFGFGPYPVPPNTEGSGYMGDDAVVITVWSEHVGSGYVEDVQLFARLHGPSTIRWPVRNEFGEAGLGGASFPLDMELHSVKPGDYTMTAWVDEGDGPVNRCSLMFAANPGEMVEITLRFRADEPCVLKDEHVGMP